jgi:hypothetical protein
MHSRLLIFGAAVMLVLAMAAAGGGPATMPAAAAAGHNREQLERIQGWLVGLADADPEVREESRYQLMGLGRGDLPGLRSVAERYRPLERSLIEMLHEVVTHVYLAGEGGMERAGAGFLGIDLPREMPEDPRFQIIVVSRMKGFVAYRSLRDGDIILEVEGRPIPAGTVNPLALRAHFTQSIQQVGAGRMVHLKVLRQGKVMRISMTLSRRPDWADLGAGNEGEAIEMRSRREQSAERYWKSEFEPHLVERPAGP